MSIIECDIRNNEEQIRGSREYPEDFGKKSEAIIMEALKKEYSPLIEEVEKGTSYEDQRELADIWIDFGEGIGVVGVQLSFSDDEETIRKKEEQIRKHPYAKKIARDNSVIKYNGNAHLVLATYNKADIASASKLWEEKIYRGENVRMEDVMGGKIPQDIMSQVIKKLPPVAKGLIIEKMTKMQKNKKAGKKSRR